MSDNETELSELYIEGEDFQEARAAVRKGEEYHVVTWRIWLLGCSGLLEGTVDEFVVLLQRLKAERLALDLYRPSEDGADLLEEIEDKIYRKCSQVKIFLKLWEASILQRVSWWLSEGYQIESVNYISTDMNVSSEIFSGFLQGISTAETLRSLEYEPSCSCS